MFGILKSQKGVSLVIFAFSLAVIAASASLAVDIGVVVFEKSRLSATIDSAALAGAQEMISNESNTTNVINDYIEKNSVPLKELEVSIDNFERILEVKGVKTVEHYFAKLFGRDSKDISSTSKVKVENVSSVKGARPFAVVDQNFTFGAKYTLKEGAGDGSSGNYGAVALGGTGGSVYRNNLIHGYNSNISVGDMISTEPGNMSGPTETGVRQLINGCTHSPRCTYQYYNKNCSRIIFIPIVDTLDVHGRDHIKVLGFATFFLEGVTNHGGQADVTGRFITYSLTGETSSLANDYGTYNIRLIK